MMRRDSGIAVGGGVMAVLVALGKLVADALRHPNTDKQIIFTDHSVKVQDAPSRQAVGR
jgi:hypothetical protein